ncbi:MULTISPECIES: NAD-dependent epimerase/dehydratase family protein [unclassified Mycobacterium]|uniref:NAD-dependent epimerase/dehydratase family protein n=1 Tax=unclassified Mycobacterium TaxID=2642494 RepID=UPI0007404A41|nr:MULTISPECIES: NAD-dependent epimerase/dehydratase family protein [unclassified Mycobacterium]KUH82873.1 NAD-dependent dehydratase [Mycobacterium sp. IS-1556]KUH83347.1 NAD-dependent dehydratase [Mycobacterium sp. GA-0227b]KUH84241.1 NAD-dependent dehydratase [Mycobacterium sp. GA-1999]
MGASGFVGSHVTRKLVERGDDVRVYLRKTSSTVAIDDLDVERRYGDLYDDEALRAAMSDRDVVYYCIVDTRFHLRDPAPLFETNVNCLRRVLEVAAETDLHRFVFCSTIGTIALGDGRGPVTEDMPFDWGDKGGAYIESRCQAEDLVLRYVRERGLPAVAMCVSNPYGPGDWQPHQGLMVQYAAFGKIPAYVRGVHTEVVGIEDVAQAFLLAGENGAIGERYIISESYMSMRDMLQTAATEVGATPPRFGVPLALVYTAVGMATAAGRLLRRQMPINITGVRLLHIMPPADHSKATRELGWQPRPTAESIRRAARFYVERAKEMAK